MKKKIILILIGIILLCVVAYWLNSLFGGWVSYDINRYSQLTATQPILPELDELGEYEKIRFKHYHNNMLIFHSDSYTLKVSYDAENYEKEKASLLENYTFRTETVVDRVDEIEYKKDPSFTIDTFDMNLLSTEKADHYYPKELIFVGTSDKKREIAYVYFYDDDLDYIDCTFDKFLKTECGW